jgi:hypothetical protein
LSSAKEILSINYASEKHDDERDAKMRVGTVIFQNNLNLHSLE